MQRLAFELLCVPSERGYASQFLEGYSREIAEVNICTRSLPMYIRIKCNRIIFLNPAEHFPDRVIRIVNKIDFNIDFDSQDKLVIRFAFEKYR